MTRAVSTPNPFSTGSKRYDVFELLKDGQPRTLSKIMGEISYWRGIGSVLRHIRAHPGLRVDYFPTLKTYKMSDY